MVIKTPGGWNRLWEWLGETPPAKLDSSRDMAVGIFLGTRLTGGYGIAILSAKEEAGVFVIHYVETKPRGIVTQALTTPYLITLLPKTDMKVTFKKWGHLFLYLANELEKRQADQALVEALAGAIDLPTGRTPEIPKEINPKAVAALIEALKIPGKDVRINAAWALGRIGPQAKAAVPGLTEALEDKDWKVRRQAVWALGAIGPDAKEAISSLIHALEDRKTDVRKEVARALGYIGLRANEVVPALIGALKDPDADVRYRAAFALGEFGPKAKAAVPALIDALNDPDEVVRRNAPQALGEIGPYAKAAVPALIRGFKDKNVRTYADSALGKIGRSAVPALIEALKDEDPIIRNNSATALGHIGPDAKDAVPALIRLFNDEQEQARYGSYVEWALGKIGKAAVPALIEALKDKNPFVRDYSALVLRDIGPEAVPALIEATKDTNLMVRARACYALVGGIGLDAKAAVRAIKELLNDEDREIRRCAYDALEKIGKLPSED
jgi:HEAT repeat protein